MFADLYDWRQNVFSGGYAFTRPKGKGGQLRILTPRDEPGEYRVRRPLSEQPNLHHLFAGLEPTEEAIVRFANEWGCLANGDEFGLENPWDDLDPDSPDGADDLDVWIEAIQEMKALIHLWKLLKARRSEPLGRSINISWHKDESGAEVQLVVEGLDDLGYCYDVGPQKWPDLFRLARAGNTAELARRGFFIWMNRKLRGACRHDLCPDPKTGQPALYLVPNHLLGAMWLLLANEVSGARKSRPCKRCGRLFPIYSNEDRLQARETKLYCGPTCRAAEYRERKEKALALHQQGKGVKEIAKQLKVKESSVRGWLKAGK